MASVKLPVIDSGSTDQPWYAGGLTFTCTQCGNCCTGGPGYVWVTKEEIRRLAAHLELSVEEALQRYCRKVGGRISFKERRMPNGNHDCIFLTEQPAACGSAEARDGTPQELQPGRAVPLSRRGCSIYPVRPLQCRTWPFWPENVGSREAWDRAGKGCHGINRGGRTFTRERIEAIRDAEDWPESPPSS